MIQKIVTVLIVLSLLPVFLFAQEKTILKPKGITVFQKGSNSNSELIPITKWEKSRMQKRYQNKNTTINSFGANNTLNLIDTLQLVTDPSLWFSNFGMFGQDRMVQWFEAPADLYLNAIGFRVYSAYTPMANIEVKIVKLNYTTEQLEFLQSAWIGSYEALGNGYHDVTAFLDDPDRTGPWTPVVPGTPEVFGNDIWSDLGVGKTITPAEYIRDSVNAGGQTTWVDLVDLGYPDITAGTIFGIVLKNLAPGLNESRVGMWGTTVNAGNQYSLWKFYADDNTNQPPTNDWGWWSRDITLGYSAIVEIYGNTGPDINSFTIIPSDVELGPFTIDANITDANPGDPGNAGVASAMIQWRTDGGTTWNDAAMTGTEPNYTGEIPAQSGNTEVTYRISATDVTNITSESNEVSFYVFQPSGANTLVIFNGFNELSGFPQDDYFGLNVSFEHDSWNYGEVTTALLDNYTNVIEIWNENFGVYNDDIIRPWIDGSSNRNYLLAGQEYLGAKNGYVDSNYVAGSFEYDILGVDSSFNDISYYYVPPTSSTSYGDSLATLVTPQAGTMFGQPLKDLFDSYTPAPDSMMFNPLGVYNSPDNLNWQDGFHAISGVQVDMMVETRGMGDNREQPIVRTIPTLAHRILGAGNKVIFHAYDPISLTTANNSSFAYYNWVSTDTLNSMYQALKWFGIETTIVGVDDDNFTVNSFTLVQNYPNPFNPSTTIQFSIPQSSKVTLKIFDILGREVSTLINENKSAGNYWVNFDASGLASGMYIYRLTAGDYTASKKMMLLK
jgi:hypothetical protein